MEKLFPLGLNHCEKPSDEPQQKAYRRNVVRPDAQNHERNPEQEEN
jgi:hypothetical protein